MIYNSFNFLILFPLIFLGYYVIPSRYLKLRNVFLLAVSYLLYFNWEPVYAQVLLGVTASTFLAARLLDIEKRKKIVVCLGGGHFP